MDQLENPYPYRKMIFPAFTGFIFTRTQELYEYNGEVKPQYDYVLHDKQGNLIPNRILDMPMHDEKIFRL